MECKKATPRFLWIVTVVVVAWSLVQQPMRASAVRLEASPTPEGDVVIEELAETPPMQGIAPGTGVSLGRITYEPGGVLDLDYPGPVMYFVDAGELAIRYTPGRDAAFFYSGTETSPPPLRATTDGLTVLPAGYAIFAETGALGFTRNAGSEPLVVLAIALVPKTGGGTTAGGVEEEATPGGT